MDLKKVKDFIIDFYKYTTTISITEGELFSKFEWLDDCSYWFNLDYANDELITKFIYQNMLYDLIFNQEAIKEQIINDLCSYEEDSEEIEYIKDFYKKWKDMFDFEIDFEEVGC